MKGLNMKWIPIDEKKPENGQICLVVCGGPAQWAALQWIENFFAWPEQLEEFFDEFPSETVTHWMPFPDDPPTE